jgi:SAM-dependent methyltransferase
MSHTGQREFVGILSANMDQFFHDCHVLEIGSLNINGTIRDHFRNCDYVGLDVAHGKDVDVVCQGQDYRAPDNSFDHVISCEAMEHNPYWAETFANMIRVCRPGGLVAMTCASTGRAEHGTSRMRTQDSPLTDKLGWDYYRNLTESNFKRRLKLDGLFSTFRFWTNWLSFDLYFCGIKKGKLPSQQDEAQWRSAVESVDQYIRATDNLKICRYRALFAHVFGDRWFIMMRALENTLAYVNGR